MVRSEFLFLKNEGEENDRTTHTTVSSRFYSWFSYFSRVPMGLAVNLTENWPKNSRRPERVVIFGQNIRT